MLGINPRVTVAVPRNRVQDTRTDGQRLKVSSVVGVGTLAAWSLLLAEFAEPGAAPKYWEPFFFGSDNYSRVFQVSMHAS